MLQNYLRVALRHLRKQKGYAAINVLGLSIGIAGALLVGLFVREELAFDRFHEKADRIHRAWVLEDYGPDEQFFNTVTPHVLGPAMAAAFPEVERVVRFRPMGGAVLRGEQALDERFVLVDSAFFDVFSFDLLQGDAMTALARPDAVVLTDSAAYRHFGEVNPVGQPLIVRFGDEERSLVVTGIVANPPDASSLQFGALVPMAQIQGLASEGGLQSWFSVVAETYILLHEGASAAALEAKLPAMLKTALGPDFKGSYVVGVQPLLDIHLNPEFPAGIAPVTDPRYLVILSTIALLLLLIACINFTTLAIGRSGERTREVGVRKALGAQREQLMGQFWGESLLLTAVALAIGVVLALVLLPQFNNLALRTLAFRLDLEMALLLVGLLAVVGLGAGGYPAVVLSGFRPVEVLRGRVKMRAGGGVQRGLVALQFALSIGLLASTFVMASQLRFLQTKNLGFDADRVVMVWNAAPMQHGLEPLQPIRAALESESVVARVSASAFALGGWAALGYTDEADRYRTFSANVVAPDFLETMQIRLSAGESFAAEPGLAAQQVVVNAAYVEAFGLEDGVGRPLPEPFAAYTLVGVTEDFHFASLHDVVEPLVLVTNPGPLFQAAENVMFGSSPAYDVIVRLQPGPLPTAMAAIEAAWTRVAPDRPFNFAFLDDQLDAQYRDEQRLGEIVRVASWLAVLIACLGLFGLAALTTQQRTKEIGVRKVLGAGVPGLVALLSKDFATLVLIAFVVAAPVAYFLMGNWLEGFAYRVTLGPGVFLLAGGLALFIALLTVSYQALRAATADPVKSLRSE